MADPPFTLRAPQPDELPRACELLADTFGGGAALWADRIDHSSRRNPAWDESMAPGFGAYASDGELLGFIVSTPFRYDGPEGDELVGCATHSLAVRPEGRGMGVAKALVVKARTQPCDFTIATQMSIGGWRSGIAAGSDPVDEPWIHQPRYIPADPKRLGRMTAARVPLLGPAAAALLRAAESLRTRAPSPDGVEEIAAFDPADDPDLRRLVARPAAYRPRRNAETLNWMYFGTPHLRRSRAVFALRRGGRLAGYAALRRLATSATLLECRSLPEAADATPALLAAAKAWARRTGLSHILAYPYSPEIRRALRRVGAVALPRPNPFTCLAKIYRPGITVADLELGPWESDAVTTDDAPALDRAPA